MKVFNNYFGEFGGRYVPEVLRKPLDELEIVFREAMEDPEFWEEYSSLMKQYVGRPTPLLYAENTTRLLGGAQVYIKLEGLANTGAHKINNALGQALIAKRMGKKRIIAETGAGQHGVATAAVCAKLGLDCHIYMGEVDIRRQRPNVFQMELYGAEVVPVTSGDKTLKDAVNEAMRDWASHPDDTHYLLGSALGPSPFPDMVREFQSVIGKEVDTIVQEKNLDVAAMVACVGGGSNAIGFFSPYLEKNKPRLIGAEAGGIGADIGQHASRMTGPGREGIVQGYKSLFLQNEDGQVLSTHSVSAGLDYAGIGPQLAHLGKTGRIEFVSITDKEALDTVKFFAEKEGVIFALESAHAGAAALKVIPTLPKDKAVIINMSGRGDKDIFITAGQLSRETWTKFLKDEVKRYES
ncbi:tryptophan synthase subunit beta [Spirochaeta cellobiosiphila]|uniref:tryptophan synthase subunit beta n=1 Tax=Spirochaeta cellobiosiphila TaxID=504483 RepID=UPI000425AAE1|nr:tryptophan synthase subunit beta [Spirochaeta cellobiosiphila]